MGEGDETQPPFSFEKSAFQWLETALDFGITEQEFWNMTLGEILRAIESKKRVQKIQAQERATFDYILADLIGRSNARIHSSSNKMPLIADVYPTLFDKEDIENKVENQKAKLFAEKLKHFANNHNNRLREVAKKNE